MILKKLCENFLFIFWPTTPGKYQNLNSDDEDKESPLPIEPNTLTTQRVKLIFRVFINSLQVGLAFTLISLMLKSLKSMFLNISFYLKVILCSMIVYIIIYSISFIIGVFHGIVTTSPETFRIRPRKASRIKKNSEVILNEKDQDFYNELRDYLKKKKQAAAVDYDQNQNKLNEPVPEMSSNSHHSNNLCIEPIQHTTTDNCLENLENCNNKENLTQDNQESTENKIPILNKKLNLNPTDSRYKFFGIHNTKSKALSDTMKMDLNEIYRKTMRKSVNFKGTKENRNYISKILTKEKVAKKAKGYINHFDVNEDNRMRKCEEVDNEKILVGILKKPRPAYGNILVPPQLKQRTSYAQQYRDRQNKIVPPVGEDTKKLKNSNIISPTKKDLKFGKID